MVERAGERSCASAPATRSPTCAAAAGSSRASSSVLEATVEDGRLRSETYPDPLARVWSALTAPHAGDFIVSLAPGFEAVDWGGVTHAGGGSHGSLHAGDSLGPLLFVGCGPRAMPSEREQWALRDVAPVVLEHFGLIDARPGDSCQDAAALATSVLARSSLLALVPDGRHGADHRDRRRLRIADRDPKVDRRSGEEQPGR